MVKRRRLVVVKESRPLSAFPIGNTRVSITAPHCLPARVKTTVSPCAIVTQLPKKSMMRTCQFADSSKMPKFVFLDSSSGQEPDIRRTIRSHAMRDFRRRQRLQRTSQPKYDDSNSLHVETHCRENSSTVAGIGDCRWEGAKRRVTYIN